MQEWTWILELENWRVRSLLLVPLGLKSILNYKPVLVVVSIHPSELKGLLCLLWHELEFALELMDRILVQNTGLYEILLTIAIL
jgi:hypothetical protein